MTKKSTGKKGEDIAEKYLLDQGFRILTRNFGSKLGEIDLIAIDKDILVFVEVKTRFSSKFGLPEEAVNYWKIRTIALVGDYYRSLHKNLPESERIDVIAIDFDETGVLKRVEQIKNVTG